MKENKKKIKNIFLTFLTCVISPILFFLISQKNKKESSKPRILVIPQLTRIGDLICSTPVFRAIKLFYPDSYLAVLVSNKVHGIIKNNPRINEAIIYEEYSFWELTKKIRKSSFNWAFSLSGTSTSTLLFMWGLVKNRVKTTRTPKPITEKLTDWFNNYRLLYKDHTYLPQHHLDLLKFIGITEPEEKKEVFFSDTGNEKAEMFLRKNNISEKDILVGISISAGNKIKEWGDEKFLSLAKTIINRHSNSSIIFIGHKSDELRINKILGEINTNKFYKSTNFSLEDKPSLINKLDLFIAVDTGLIYVAHSLGIPLIDIVGPVQPSFQPPEDEKSIRILPEKNIMPTIFAFKESGDPTETKKALESITVEEVLKAVDKLLKI